MKIRCNVMIIAWLFVCPAFVWADGMEEALRTTLTYNPSVKGKLAEVTAQYHNISNAKAQRLPSLYVEANDLNNNRNQGTVGLDQPLWTFGKISTAIAREEEKHSAEEWDLLRVKRQLIEDTAVAYAAIRGANSRTEIATQNVQIQYELYQQIHRRQQGRLASEVDVDLAYSRWQQAKSQLMIIRNQALSAEAELFALTQMPINVDAPITDEQLRLPPDSSLMDIALQENASIKRQRELVKVSELDLKSEKIAVLPDISFRLEHDFLDDDLVNQDGTRSGFVLSSRFSGLGFGAYSATKSAASRLSAAHYQLDASAVDVHRRLQTLIQDRAIQQQLIESNELAVKAIIKTQESYQRLYDNGRRTWLELLNTYREKTEQLLTLEQSKSDWKILTLRIAAVIGELDDDAGVGTSLP